MRTLLKAAALLALVLCLPAHALLPLGGSSGSAPTCAITSSTPLPSATVGTPYSTTLATANCTAPLTWSLLSATPNTGTWLSLGSSTGTLSGTPSTAETESLSVEAADSVGHMPTSPFTLVVNGSGNPLGINVVGTSYYSTEQPFLNIVKNGGDSASYGDVGWYTGNSSTDDTAEEAYLQLDSNGYPTSMTASPTPPGGQQFTNIFTLLNYGMGSAPPGATYVYPPGQYRLKFEGQGTLSLIKDASVQSGDTCGAGVTLSNSAPNTYVSCTFHVLTPGADGGIQLNISAITSSTDYPRDISVVQEAYAASYDAGAIFNPAFLAVLAPFKSVRFMDWSKTNNEFAGITVSGSAIAQNATSTTLQSNWNEPSGTYPMLFIDGEQRTGTFTLGSPTVTWTGGLTNAITSTTWGSQNNYANFWIPQHSWAKRPLPSNAFWSVVPLEVEVALANQLGANAHFNVPEMYSDSDIEAEGQLVMSGTGMQSGYSALSSGATANFELSNETWNSAFAQYGATASLGAYMWPTQSGGGGNYAWNRYWYGMRVAQMAADLQTAVGSTLFARVIPVMAAQAANNYSVVAAFQCSYYSGAPCNTSNVKAIAIAPYWGGNLSSADCTEMTGQGDGGLADFNATLYSQIGASGYTYSSVPNGGWLGSTEGSIASYATLMASYPTMHLIAYEGGQSFYACYNTGACQSSVTCAGWPALVTAAERTAFMGQAYTNYIAYWDAHAGSSASNMLHLWNDATPIGISGAFGLLESTMQTISPLTAAPTKYAAAVGTIQ